MNALGLWTLPNLVTWSRVVLSVPVIMLLVSGSQAALWWALVLMFISEVSDGVDGWVARRTGQVSAVGKILDPMSDSIYRICVFTAFVANGWMPVWMLLIFVWRDLIVSYLRLIAERFITTMAARRSGKWKAVAQGVAQGAVVLAYALLGTEPGGTVDVLLWGVLLLAAGVTLYSLVDYAASVAKRLGSASDAV